MNTLKFDGNGATGGSTADMSIYTDQTKALTANGFEKEGYTFIGWAMSANGEVVYGDGANYTMGVNAEYTLYAKWQANLNTLKFNGNGATGGSTAQMSIYTDETKALTANGFVKAGYTFIGWAIEGDGEVVYTDGANYTMGTNAEYTLYAKWQANLNTLKFNGNGATGGSTAQMSIYTDETKALTANSFEKVGYTFIGWATSENGDVVYTDGANYTMGANAEYTLYAVWSPSGATQTCGRNKIRYRAYTHTQKQRETCKANKINAEYLEKVVKMLITNSINEYLKASPLSQTVFSRLEKETQEKVGKLSRYVSDLETKINLYLEKAANIHAASKLVERYEQQATECIEAQENARADIEKLNSKLKRM